MLVLFVKKKDGSLCLCVDFYSFNHITKKNCYPLSLISNLLNSSCKVQIYTKTDFCHAYYLVGIINGDEWKTAFKTHYKSFKWSVISFGLTNTLTAF